VDRVSVSFGAFKAVREVSLSVDEHAIVGLIGPNGAGKTTLFNAVTGLVRMQSGNIWFSGNNISKFSPVRRARKGIGRSFQNLGLLMGETVATNVLGAQFLASNYQGWDAWFRPWRWRHGEQVIYDRAVEMLEHFGLKSYLRTRVSDLSFASARFVELCGVLARSPQLVLLDEPTTGLGRHECERLRESLLRSQREFGVTVLVISHDVSFVMSATEKIYVLAEGKVLMEGSPDEVRQDPGVIEAYLGTKSATK
jgi:branched-chain amino acid transport system ATP-binding protein